MILSVSNLSKSYDGKPILKNISFHIEAHDKCAVTGVNGAGKSTLLKQITGEETPDEGSVVLAKDAKLAYLSQTPEIHSKKSIYEEVLSVRTDLLDMEAELRSLEKEMQEHAQTEEALDQVYKRYEKLMHAYETGGGYALKSNVVGILKGLGFQESEFDKPVSVLSGGQKTRLALGRLLLAEPDLLLLDEPTNHLDIDSIAWLENYLRAWRGAVLIVSHDRYFLDRIVSKVLDIDSGHARLYTGNYTAFADKKAALRKDMMKAYLNNQAEIKHQQEVIAKLRQFNREKSIKRAESREKMLAKIERVEKPFEVEDAMQLHFTPARISGNDVLQAENLSKRYGSQQLFSGVSLDVKRGEKLAIIGPNGTGKTTLLKIIDGAETPDSGALTFGSRVQLAYYDQEHHVLDPENTVFEEISDAYPSMNNTEIRSLLAAFLFTGEDVFKLVGDLSGGEKGRLSLAKLMLSKANLLLLDEPTNHLDITSKEILEEAIRNYEGTVIYVSHDRYFINRTATRILELSGGSFINYIGNYDYYLEKKADPNFDAAKAISGSAKGVSSAVQPGGAQSGSSSLRSSAAQTAPLDAAHASAPSSTFSGDGALRGAASRAGAANASNSEAEALKTYMQTERSRAALSFQEQKERKSRRQKMKNALSACEKSIHLLEQRDFELDELMSHTEIATNSAKLNELSAEKAEISAKLEKLYADWETQSEALEAFDNEM